MRNKKFIVFVFLIVSAAFFPAFSLIRSNEEDVNLPNLNINGLKTSDPKGFNILDFWDKERERVENTDLNIQFVKNHSIVLKDPYSEKIYTFTAQEIYFQSPNWVNGDPAVLSLHGFILYPNNLKDKNPASLIMHGLGKNANSSFEFAFSYLKKGFIVLCHSHPGHGQSEGASPTSDNFYYQGAFNETSHNYLTICGAIQGLRVLETLNYVNKSQIMVTGTSYGAMNTMWLSGICGDRIAGALPYIALGDNKKLLEDPNKLLFWLWNMSATEIPESFWENQNLRIDPKYYLQSEKIPIIMWQIGTADEFFHYLSINGTLGGLSNQKFIQIYPEGHHGLSDYQNTTQFFIDYILNQGPEPPTINIELNEKKQHLIGNTIYFDISVNCDIQVEYVEVVYKYLDIIGQTWQSKKLSKYSPNMYSGVIEPGSLSSEVDYYFIVHLEGDENVWFSSTIYNGGTVHSTFTFFVIAMMIIGTAFPLVYLIRKDFRKNLEEIEGLNLKREIQQKLIFKNLLIIFGEGILYISFFLPFVTMNSVSWSTIYLLNNIYTWQAIFGVISSVLPYLIIIISILSSFLSLEKPIIGGILKMLYFGYMTLFYQVFMGLLAGSSDLNGFAPILLGSGYYLILISGIILILTGVWNRMLLINLDTRKE